MSKLTLKERVILFIATVGPCGYVPVGRGTCGALAGAVCFFLVYAFIHRQLFFGRTPSQIFQILFVMTAVLCWFAARVAAAAEKILGGKNDRRIVIDEFAAAWIVFLPMPNWIWDELIKLYRWIVPFLIFRLLDAVKPPPCRWLGSLPNGYGMVADDAMAAIYSWGFTILWIMFVYHAGWHAWF